MAGHEGYLTVGLYENNHPGELFITMSKEGSTIGGLMDSLGTAISVALQYGVPIESLVTKFMHQRFEPMGMTTNRDIPFAKSLVDYIFRWMGMEFIQGFREANAPPRPSAPPSGEPPSPPDTLPVKEDQDWLDKRQQEIAPPRIAVSGGNANGPSGADASAAVIPGVPVKTDANGGLPVAAERISVEQSTVVTTDTNGSAVTPSPMAGTISATATMTSTTTSIAVSALDQAHAAMQSDAPACDVCGAITVRSATCYKCMHCGNSLGCS